MEIPKPNYINFLVKRKFPEYRAGKNQSAETEAYAKELRAKSQEQLKEIYMKEVQAIRLSSGDDEDRFFNLPHVIADFEHWSKAADWTLDEAIALAFGKAPEIVNWSSVEKYAAYSPFAIKYARLRDLALRAKRWHQLYDPVMPGVFLAWARRLEINVPTELVERVEKRGVVIADWQEQYDKLKEQYELLRTQADAVAQKQSTSEGDQRLRQSDYWQRLRQLATRAIDEYPDWEKSQRRVQKTANLNEWLKNSIGADTRETEILKKILSNFFKDLR